MSAHKQRGLVLTETAIVGLVVMIVMFGVLELGRMFFVINALEEAARRGARVAAVCQVNDPAIAQMTIFNASGDSGPSGLIYNLSTGNVDVGYLNDSGAVVADPVGNYLDIAYVRVSIVNYQHQLLIPMFIRTINLPEFMATLPRESLGVTPTGFTTC